MTSGMPELNTTDAASGSPIILASAQGVTFPSQLAAPPIKIISLTRLAKFGSLLIARAILVNLATARIVISFGLALVESTRKLDAS